MSKLKWETFKIKNENQPKAFEQLCGDWIKWKFLSKDAISHSNPNQAGIEIEPIWSEKLQKRISYQSKFFSSRNKMNEQIKDSLEKVPNYYTGKLDQIYLFSNLQVNKDTRSYKEIEQLLNDSSIELILIDGDSLLREMEDALPPSIIGKYWGPDYEEENHAILKEISENVNDIHKYIQSGDNYSGEKKSVEKPVSGKNTKKRYQLVICLLLSASLVVILIKYSSKKNSYSSQTSGSSQQNLNAETIQEIQESDSSEPESSSEMSFSAEAIQETQQSSSAETFNAEQQDLSIGSSYLEPVSSTLSSKYEFDPNRQIYVSVTSNSGTSDVPDIYDSSCAFKILSILYNNTSRNLKIESIKTEILECTPVETQNLQYVVKSYEEDGKFKARVYAYNNGWKDIDYGDAPLCWEVNQEEVSLSSCIETVYEDDTLILHTGEVKGLFEITADYDVLRDEIENLGSICLYQKISNNGQDELEYIAAWKVFNSKILLLDNIPQGDHESSYNQEIEGLVAGIYDVDQGSGTILYGGINARPQISDNYEQSSIIFPTKSCILTCRNVYTTRYTEAVTEEFKVNVSVPVFCDFSDGKHLSLKSFESAIIKYDVSDYDGLNQMAQEYRYNPEQILEEWNETAEESGQESQDEDEGTQTAVQNDNSLTNEISEDENQTASEEKKAGVTRSERATNRRTTEEEEDSDLTQNASSSESTMLTDEEVLKIAHEHYGFQDGDCDSYGFPQHLVISEYPSEENPYYTLLLKAQVDNHSSTRDILKVDAYTGETSQGY